MGRVPFSRYIVSFIYIYFAQNIYEKYTICISNSSTCQQHFMVVGVQDLSDSHPMNHLKCCHFDLVDLYVGFSCYSFNNNLSKKMQIGSQNSFRKSV